jgi:hypothetical protein
MIHQRLTKSFRYMALSLTLSLLLLGGCQGGGGAAGMAGGCSGGAVLNATDNVTSDDEYFNDSFPVGIPVTIAKNENGVDPASIQFVQTSSQLNISASSSSPVVGQITGSTVDGVLATIAFISNNEFIEIADTDASGNFSFDMTEDLLNSAIAVVVAESLDGAGEPNLVTPPVIFSVFYDPFQEAFDVQVVLTNVDSSVESESVSGDILPGDIGVSLDGDVAVNARINSSSFSISSLNIQNGFLLHLATGFDEGFNDMQYDNDGNIYAMGSETGILYKLDTEGNLFIIGPTDAADVPNNPGFKVHPSGRGYLMMTVLRENPNTSQESIGLDFVKLDGTGTLEVDIEDEELLNVDDLSMAWTSPAAVTVIRQFDDSSQELKIYNVGRFLKTGSAAALGGAVYTQDLNLSGRDPVTVPISTQTVIYQCVDDEGNDNYCAAANTDDREADEPILDIGFSATQAEFMPVLSEVLITVEDDNDRQGVALFDPTGTGIREYDDLTFVAFGSRPTYVPDIGNGFLYMSDLVTGSYQVGVKKIGDLDDYLTPVDITNAGSSATMSVGNNYLLQVGGGVAPYHFISSNQSVGTVESYSGYFTAVKAGTTRVTVVDALGDTNAVTVTVE